MYERKEKKMSKDTYDKIMAILDVIERELDIVAATLGHPSFAEWNKLELQKEDK
jgi:hypothetical protein